MSELTAVEKLEEREAIRELLGRYCYAIARRDVDAVVEMFADDCQVETLGQPYDGKAGLRELYRSSLDGNPKPTFHCFVLEALDARAAQSRSVFEIAQVLDGEEQRVLGCYEDRFVKEGGRWKFQRRSFRAY